MNKYEKIEDLSQYVGKLLGTSDWIEVTQDRIQLFADATGDHQWIHLDAERARSGPYKGTIAHGFLTLSLLPSISANTYSVGDVGMGVNYGLNKIRFPAPVPSGSRVRGHIQLLSYEPIEGGAQLTSEVQIELEGATKPVCVAEAVARLYKKV